MPGIATLSRALLNRCKSSLRAYAPSIFQYEFNDFSKPLLSTEEINDLQSRVGVKNKRPIQLHETAEQRIGDQASIYYGRGLDYEESRAYQAGDDPRYMNWKLSAKTGEFFMKIFRQERRPAVLILIDRRNTMLFGTRTRLKVTQAARVATCIAFSAKQQSSTISAIILERDSNTPTLIKEKNETLCAEEIVRVACAPCSPTNKISLSPDDHSFDYALSILQETQVTGSTIYLISDFIDLCEQHKSALMGLASVNTVHAIQIVDPTEKDLPDIGNLHFFAGENKQDVIINTSESNTRNTYKKQAQQHFSAQKEIFYTLNISHTEIMTDDDRLESILHD